jgi:hypothetical protein
MTEHKSCRYVGLDRPPVCPNRIDLFCWLTINSFFRIFSSPLNIKTIFRSLIGFFKQAEIDYAVVGAFALKAYGYLRATQDVDFLVRGTHQTRIIEYLESLGYETIYRSADYSIMYIPSQTLEGSILFT